MSSWPDALRIHLVGVGGAGMSSMALFLKEKGAVVTGSDRCGSALTDELQQRGIGVQTVPPHEVELPCELDTLVYTAAVGEDDPRVSRAKELGCETVKYAVMLGRIMDGFIGVGVAGSHGKTSVAGLSAYLLTRAGMSPSYVVGGWVQDLCGGGGGGSGEHFIAEACEFDRSFLNIDPGWAVITNIEADHLDYYGTFESMLDAFRKYIAGVADRCGNLILSDHAARVLDLPEIQGLTAWTYGFQEGCDLLVSDYDLVKGSSVFRLTLRREDMGMFKYNRPGYHNVMNAAAASFLALELGAPPEAVKEALPLFAGIRRRLEDRGTFGGVRLFSDYAHHPTEIRAVLDTLRSLQPNARIVVTYQGHQRWRNSFFLEELAKALSGFDLALLVKTFSVREKDSSGLPGGEAIAQAVSRCGGRSCFVGGLDDAPSAIRSSIEDGDLLVLMGAGSIDGISGAVEKELSMR